MVLNLHLSETECFSYVQEHYDDLFPAEPIYLTTLVCFFILDVDLIDLLELFLYDGFYITNVKSYKHFFLFMYSCMYACVCGGYVSVYRCSGLHLCLCVQ